MSLFQPSNQLFVVEAEEDYGFHYIASEIASSQTPVMWVRLTAAEAGDKVEQGRLLAQAAETAFGAPLFGVGLPYAYGVATIKRHVELLAPFNVILSGAEFGVGLAESLSAFAVCQCKVILHFGHIPGFVEIPAKAVRYTAKDLEISSFEMAEVVKTEAPEFASEIPRYATFSKGRYQVFRKAFTADAGNKSTTRVGFGFSNNVYTLEESDSTAILQSLFARARWREAFEIAARGTGEWVPTIVAKAGSAYFQAGQYRQFYDQFALLTPELLEDPSVAYWRFAGAVATNNHYKILPEIIDYLEKNDAPDLRAHVAISIPGPESLNWAIRAYEEGKSAITTRALGFAYCVSGNQELGIRYLLSAFNLASSTKDMLLAVAAATELAMAHQMSGQYRDALSWAGKALDMFTQGGMKEELRRLFIVSELVFPSLLLGRRESVGPLVESLVLDGVFGIPSLEGLISTVCDFYIAIGNPAAALELSRRNAAALPDEIASFGNFGVVRALIAGGHYSEACTAATSLKSPTASRAEQRWYDLSYGIALFHIKSPDSVTYLQRAQDNFLEYLNAPALAMASIHLARHYVESRLLEKARGVLRKGAPGLRELSFQGWKLLGGHGDSVLDTWKLWCQDSPQLEIKFLGARSVRYDGKTRDFPSRYCEVLAALAHTRAVSGDRLASMLYEDGGNMSTIKSILSRLRKEIPIGSKPYRLGVSWQADFVQLQEALREGRVRDALELYRGPLLPGSDAPFIVEMRDHLEEALRQSALASGDVDVLLALARKLGDDLELWEAVSQRLSSNDPLLALAKAHVKRIQRSWQA